MVVYNWIVMKIKWSDCKLLCTVKLELFVKAKLLRQSENSWKLAVLKSYNCRSLLTTFFLMLLTWMAKFCIWSFYKSFFIICKVCECSCKCLFYYANLYMWCSSWSLLQWSQNLSLNSWRECYLHISWLVTKIFSSYLIITQIRCYIHVNVLSLFHSGFVGCSWILKLFVKWTCGHTGERSPSCKKWSRNFFTSWKNGKWSKECSGQWYS